MSISYNLKELNYDIRCINTLRLLSVDMIENANSGHPGMPLGCAAIIFILFKNHLKFNPDEPEWINRDRFILSNGHGCALLYSILHLFNYEISLDDLKNFRKLGSITPGHPEKNVTPGIEVTTGPLGQGFANGVGMAIASKHISSRLDNKNSELFNNKIYVMCGDGCLMEGISNESASLAGHLKLDNLIVLYDDNKISIDGSTELSFTENVQKKYESIGWEVLIVESADEDLLSINNAINNAKKSDKPVLICMRTKIGFGSDKEGSEKSHGAPLGVESTKKLKNIFKFDEEKSFYVEEKVKKYIDEIVKTKKDNYQIWNKSFNYKDYNKIISSLDEIDNEIKGIEDDIISDKPLATRQISGLILKELSKKVKNLIGGSADLSPSNNTVIDKGIQKDNYERRYIHYGVREHSMSAMANGISTFGLIPYVGTFLVFINYCLASIRLSAISKHHVLYIFTHDSIGLGEDGPTHQPIESLTVLRSIPNSLTFRPADGRETIGCYSEALNQKDKPSCICLSRQSLPQLSGTKSNMVSKGGYTIYQKSNNDKLDLILISTGSEVHLCLEVAKELSSIINVRVVSLPCVELFDSQSNDYKLEILPKNITKISVEAGSTLGWFKYADYCYGIDCYGSSGKGNDVMNYFGFSNKKLLEYIKNIYKINDE